MTRVLDRLRTNVSWSPRDDDVPARRGRTPTPGLRIAGTVRETLLFGDEREVALDVPGTGRVVAVVDARDSHELVPGAPAEFYVPASEVVLVPKA
jgi:hypothetical protein